MLYVFDRFLGRWFLLLKGVRRFLRRVRQLPFVAAFRQRHPRTPVADLSRQVDGLRAKKSEAELAGILGHEISHVTERHTINAIKKSKGVELTAEMSRRHNDSNVLCMGGRFIAPELAICILTTWLDTPFEGERHQRRVDQLSDIGKPKGKTACST